MAETQRIFPFENLTANQMTAHERDAAYEELHERWPEGVYDHAGSGMQVVWGYHDTKYALMNLSNKNSLDPFVGYPRIMRTPGTTMPFLKDLVPPPSRATANAPHDAQHKKLWAIMAGYPEGHYTILPQDRISHAEKLKEQFDKTWRALGYAAYRAAEVDVTDLAVSFAAHVTSEAVGLPDDAWPQVAKWSKAQSGLLGQDLRGKELVEAVEGLGGLFRVSKQAVGGEVTMHLAERLREANIPRKIAVAAIANSLAAGVYTIGGTIPQGVERLLEDPEREWWHELENPEKAALVTQKILQLDPGLVAWKRYAVTPTALPSGATLHKGPVLAHFAAANRDPAVFKNLYDLESKGGQPILTFGRGAHLCPGRDLAALGIEVFLQELHMRLPNASRMPAPSPHTRSADLIFSSADVTVK